MTKTPTKRVILAIILLLDYIPLCCLITHYPSMATNLVPKRLTDLFLVLVLANITYLAKATEPKKTSLSLYFHDTPDRCDSNFKVIPVTRIAGKAWNVPNTGTVIVTEDLITKTSGQNSAEVGRAKGMYVTAGSNGLDSQVSISIEFTDEEYKGSTIEIQGISNQFMPGAEVSVVGGTGKFRFARGYATFATHHLDIPNRYAIIRCDITVQLHCC